MSNYSLIEAFIGGHYPTEASPHSPATHLFRNGNDRDKALIYMLDKQLKYRKKEAENIRRNNNANTNLLLNELENGNRELESLQTGIARLETTNYEGFRAVCDSMDVTNGLLDDISWRLGQAVNKLGDIDFKLGKILNVLEQNRKNEAKQLVNQGARLMLYGDYSGAEERFKLAYNFDVTDYQVLMNLGHVELQKQNAEKAKGWYKKASTLPLDIDGYARSLPIWNIARIHYAKKEFGEAYTYAQRAAQTHDETLDENIFKVAIYAGLAGYKSECLNGIERAIHMNPKFFRAAIAHPDLHHIRNDVYRSLDAITNQYNASIGAKIDTCNSCFNLLKNINLASVANNVLSNVMPTGQSIISNGSFIEKWRFYQINDASVSNMSDNIHRIESRRKTILDKATAILDKYYNVLKKHDKEYYDMREKERQWKQKKYAGKMDNDEILAMGVIFVTLPLVICSLLYDVWNETSYSFLFGTPLVIICIYAFIREDSGEKLKKRGEVLYNRTAPMRVKVKEAESLQTQGTGLAKQIEQISLEIADELKYSK